MSLCISYQNAYTTQQTNNGIIGLVKLREYRGREKSTRNYYVFYQLQNGETLYGG